MGAFLDLFRVLYEPGAVFGRVAEKPKFLVPFIGVAILLMVVAYFTIPFQQAAMASRMAQIAQTNPQAAETAKKFAGIGLVVVPIIFAIVLLIATLVLWVLVSTLGGEGKFGTLLSVTTYSSITGVLLQVITLVVLTVKGIGNISSPADMQPPLGLNLLMPGTQGFLGAFLGGINLFAIWGVILNAIGIQITHKTSKGTAYTAAIVAALIILLVFSGLAGLAPKQ